MLVLTIDQVDSRGQGDRVAALLPELTGRWGPHILLGPDRTAGDEFQLAGGRRRCSPRDRARAHADRGLERRARRRRGRRSAAGDDAGSGGRGVRRRPRSGRRAKRAEHRFALETDREPAREEAADVEALTDLLLEVRARRSAEGWAVADRLGGDATQVAVAASSGSPPGRQPPGEGGLRLEARAVPALVRALERLDGAPLVAEPVNASGPLLALAVVGWSLLTVPSWPRRGGGARPSQPAEPPWMSTAVGLTVLALIVAALPPVAAPAAFATAITIAALVIAVAGGSPVTRAVLDRVTFDEPEGAHGGLLASDGRELLRGGEVIGLLERFAVAGAIIAGFPDALAVVIAIKGVGRFTELGPVRPGAVHRRHARAAGSGPRPPPASCCLVR